MKIQNGGVETMNKTLSIIWLFLLVITAVSIALLEYLQGTLVIVGITIIVIVTSFAIDTLFDDRKDTRRRR